MNQQELYAQAFDEGFKFGVETVSDVIYAKAYDIGFSAGFKACQDELGLQEKKND
jgi:hypothetical protein